jgi:hypothetical protein
VSEGIIIMPRTIFGWNGLDSCFSLIRLGKLCSLGKFRVGKLMASVTIAATLILGWSMQVRADLAVPVVFSFFVGAGTSFLATSRSRLCIIVIP